MYFRVGNVAFKKEWWVIISGWLEINLEDDWGCHSLISLVTPLNGKTSSFLRMSLRYIEATLKSSNYLEHAVASFDKRKFFWYLFNLKWFLDLCLSNLNDCFVGNFSFFPILFWLWLLVDILVNCFMSPISKSTVFQQLSFQ